MSDDPTTTPGEENPVPYTPSNTWQENRLDLSKVTTITNGIRQELAKVIIGQSTTIDLLIAALFSGGHVLLEGVPGIAKTLLARLLAQTVQADFSRIQFTPDLMPTDVVGTTVFNMQRSEFTFNQGPVFSNIVLIDEINRAPAKTQAALFEVMEPEAQLDRFLFKIIVQYPNLEEEKAILYRFRKDFKQTVQDQVQGICSKADMRECQEVVEKVHIKDELLDYIASIIHGTRNNGDLFLGASPRASLAILKSAKAIAAMNGRDFVTPDDIQYVAYPVLNHRVILTPEREMEGYDQEYVVNDIVKKIEVPR